MTVPHNSDKWRKSTFTQDQGACVELHPQGAIRDSKDPGGPIIKAGYAGLLAAVKAGSLTR
jgi:hypothetical protein